MTSTLEKIKDQAREFSPGILRPGQSFQSHIGHTVINLSEFPLTEPQHHYTNLTYPRFGVM